MSLQLIRTLFFMVFFVNCGSEADFTGKNKRSNNQTNKASQTSDAGKKEIVDSKSILPEGEPYSDKNSGVKNSEVTNSSQLEECKEASGKDNSPIISMYNINEKLDRSDVGYVGVYVASNTTLDIDLKSDNEEKIPFVCLFITTINGSINLHTNANIGKIIVLSQSFNFHMDIKIEEGKKVDEIDLREITSFQSDINIEGPGNYLCPKSTNIISLNSSIKCDNN